MKLWEQSNSSNALKRGGALRHPNARRGLTCNCSIESVGDRGNAVDQRVIEGTSLSERSSHYADDQTRDDNVLERHHAVLVRAQTLQRFASLDVVLQHMSSFISAEG